MCSTRSHYSRQRETVKTKGKQHNTRKRKKYENTPTTSIIQNLEFWTHMLYNAYFTDWWPNTQTLHYPGSCCWIVMSFIFFVLFFLLNLGPTTCPNRSIYDGSQATDGIFYFPHSFWRHWSSFALQNDAVLADFWWRNQSCEIRSSSLIVSSPLSSWKKNQTSERQTDFWEKFYLFTFSLMHRRWKSMRYMMYLWFLYLIPYSLSPSQPLPVINQSNYFGIGYQVIQSLAHRQMIRYLFIDSIDGIGLELANIPIHSYIIHYILHTYQHFGHTYLRVTIHSSWSSGSNSYRESNAHTYLHRQLLIRVFVSHLLIDRGLFPHEHILYTLYSNMFIKGQKSMTKKAWRKMLFHIVVR